MGGRRKTARWVKPELPAEIAFRAWTDDGKLRHASPEGLRERKDAADVFDPDWEANIFARWGDWRDSALKLKVFR